MEQTDFEDGSLAGRGKYCNDGVRIKDYVSIVWRRKWFILLFSVCPALVAGVFLFFSPKDSHVDFIYNMEYGAKSFQILISRFYSTNNLEQLVKEFNNKKLNRYAEKLANATTYEASNEIISLTTSPPYFGPDDQKDNILQSPQDVKSNFLIMHLKASENDDLTTIAEVYRNNLEQFMPLCSEKEALKDKIVSLKENIADIEETRYALNQRLESREAVSEKLKTLDTSTISKIPSEVVLQFGDLANSRSFLPLPYQVQAAEVGIIDLEDQIETNKIMHTYYTALLGLNEMLLNYAEGLIASYSTMSHYELCISDILEQYKDEPLLLDYLTAYRRRIETKMTNVSPIADRPKIYLEDMDTARKTIVVFAAAFMMAVFIVFLSDGFKNNRV